MMQHKRNGFLTFCFSCIPGAGQMFLGFLKEGVSLMFLFFGWVALTSWLHLDVLLYITPVIWFYAFFDAMNKNALPDEKFETLEDHYLFDNGLEELQGIFSGKGRIVLSLFLILIGLHFLVRNIWDVVEDVFGVVIPVVVYEVGFYYIPRLVVACLIIGAGLYLIIGKKPTTDGDFGGEQG